VPAGPEPTNVDVARDGGLALTWPGGRVTRYGLEELRVSCPCAECRGLRERGETPWPRPSSPQPLRIEDAELVGAWGITLHWNDGHGTGIFSWEFLLAWHEPDGADPPA
jgi:DUF971 family protein